MHGGDAAFAKAVRDASQGGSERHHASRASVCSVPRTSLKVESERLVRRKERTASAGQPVSSIVCTVCSPARAGLVLGSVVGLNGPGACMGSVEPVRMDVIQHEQIGRITDGPEHDMHDMRAWT